MNFTRNQALVMQHYAESVTHGWVMPFGAMAELTGLSRPAVKRAIRQLAKLGYLELSTGFSEDTGLIAGSGYMLTHKGEIWAKQHRDKCWSTAGATPPARPQAQRSS